MIDPVPLSLLANFSADGRVYQAFERYIAPATGRILMVPSALVYVMEGGWARNGISPPFGSAVVPGCPVPVEEIAALLDTPPVRPVRVDPASMLWQLLAAMAESDWVQDTIALSPGSRRRVLRVRHPCGIVYGEVMP